MARGGRGGGRGGRGGGAQLPSGWGIMEDPDPRPMELFPPYNPTPPTALSAREAHQVSSFLRFRKLCRAGPLFTAHRGRQAGPGGPKMYTREQINAQYAVESKASVDPFTATETWDSQMASTAPRTLPDFSRMAFCKSSFPNELHETIDPTSSSSRTSRPARTTTGWFAHEPELDLPQHQQHPHDATLSMTERLDRLAQVYKDDEADTERGHIDGDGGEGEEQLDDVEYDDDDAGDYEAEAYFDGGDEIEDSGGGGGGDEPDF